MFLLCGEHSPSSWNATTEVAFTAIFWIILISLPGSSQYHQSSYFVLFYLPREQSRWGSSFCRKPWRVSVPPACQLDTFNLSPQSLTNPSWWSHKNQSQKALTAGGIWRRTWGFSVIFTHENRELHSLEPAAASKTDFSVVSCSHSSSSPSQAASWMKYLFLPMPSYRILRAITHLWNTTQPGLLKSW